MKKKRFMLAVSFTNISREYARKVLEETLEHQSISEKGFWNVVEDEEADYVLIEGKKIMFNPGFDEEDPRDLYSYASILVTRIMDVDSVSLLYSLLTRLYEAGALVTSTSCVKIYFLDKYSKKVAKQVMERLIPWNSLLYTSLLFPDVLRPFSIGDFEYLGGGYDEDAARAFENLRQEAYHCHKWIIEGLISNRISYSLNKFMIEDFLNNAKPT